MKHFAYLCINNDNGGNPTTTTQMTTTKSTIFSRAHQIANANRKQHNTYAAALSAALKAAWAEAKAPEQNITLKFKVQSEDVAALARKFAPMAHEVVFTRFEPSKATFLPAAKAATQTGKVYLVLHPKATSHNDFMAYHYPEVANSNTRSNNMSKAQQWDDLYNDGVRGGGYNPYR